MYIPIWFIVLAVALFFVYRSYEKKKEFKPVHIVVLPNWDELFKNYNVTNDNSWKEKIPKDGNKNNIYEWGINFTILSPSLIFDNNYNRFKTKIEFERGFGEIGADMLSFLFVYSGVGGYEVGLKLPKSGGKRKSLDEELLFIKVATIPFPELVLCEFGQKKQKEIDQNLQKDGWTKAENDHLIYPNKTMEHKYFSVSYEYIQYSFYLVLLLNFMKNPTYEEIDEQVHLIRIIVQGDFVHALEAFHKESKKRILATDQKCNL